MRLWVAADGREKKEDADHRRCFGRSRGGLTTKLHAAVIGEGMPVRLILTAGQCGDAPQASALLSELKPQHILADAAYDSATKRKRPTTSASRGSPRS